jgi:hypothetical protein
MSHLRDSSPGCRAATSARSTSAGELPKDITDALDGPRDPDRTEQRVLVEIVRLSSDAEKSRHARYLAMFQLVQRRDRELADPFQQQIAVTSISTRIFPN